MLCDAKLNDILDNCLDAFLIVAQTLQGKTKYPVFSFFLWFFSFCVLGHSGSHMQDFFGANKKLTCVCVCYVVAYAQRGGLLGG